MLLDPDSPSLAQASGLLPAGLVPPVPVTNAGRYGYALDTETSPARWPRRSRTSATSASSGDPRGWDDAGELTPLRRMAEAFAGRGLPGLDGTAWYHPLRLTIDAGAVAAGNANPAQKVLDVHATHGDDLPRSLRIYAFAAALGGTRVLDAAKTLAKQSHLPAGQPHPGRPPHAPTPTTTPTRPSRPRTSSSRQLVPFLKALD